jgi:hypothetical protein
LVSWCSSTDVAAKRLPPVKAVMRSILSCRRSGTVPRRKDF